MENLPLQYVAPPILHKWLESFKEFPPRAKAASFTIDQVVQQMTNRAA
jgi:arylsulfatase